MSSVGVSYAVAGGARPATASSSAVSYSGTLCRSAAVLRVAPRTFAGRCQSCQCRPRRRQFLSWGHLPVLPACAYGRAKRYLSASAVRSADRAAVLLAMFASVCRPGWRASTSRLAPLHALSLWLGLGLSLPAAHSVASRTLAAAPALLLLAVLAPLAALHSPAAPALSLHLGLGPPLCAVHSVAACGPPLLACTLAAAPALPQLGVHLSAGAWPLPLRSAVRSPARSADRPCARRCGSGGCIFQCVIFITGHTSFSLEVLIIFSSSHCVPMSVYALSVKSSRKSVASSTWNLSFS